MRSLLTSHRLGTVLQIVLSLSITLLPLIVSAAPSGMPFGASVCPPNAITLLEPLPDGTKCLFPSSNPFGALNAYLRPMLSWMVGMAAGLSLLMVIIGGIQIIMADGDSGKIGEGKKRVTEAILGLLLLVLSGTILYFLNSDFFKLQ